MSEYCVRCFNVTVKEGTCTNCGFTDAKIDLDKIAEARKLIEKMAPISESAVSRMAKTDEQEKAVRNLERSLNKINVKLDNTSMVGETFKAVVNHNKQSYHVSVDPMGKVVVHDRDVNPRKVNELKSALGMEIPKDEPTTEEKAEGSKLFQKKDLKEDLPIKEGVGADEAPKTNENPDSQLITDDAAGEGEINMTDYVAEYIDPAIKELGFERTNAHYIADGIMLYYAHRGDGRKLDIKVH